jgi:uncharacterized protein (DUF1697 family)
LTPYVALLRAVNVGGSGKLAMADLRAVAQAAGFAGVRTYIASGNLLFASEADEGTVKAALEAALTAQAGRPLGVLVRTGAEMAAVVSANPFGDAPANHTVAFFLDAPPPPDFLTAVTGRRSEAIAPGLREIYVHYPDGQGDSKLRIPAARFGTARNLNTVAALARLAGG